MISTREWHRNDLYCSYFRPYGIEYELCVSLSHPPEETHVLLFDRGLGRDFSERDHLVLALLRPHLDAALRRLTERPRVSAREREVLVLARAGYTNTHIARELHLSPATVRTHFRNIFDRLGVHSRNAALAAVGDQL